MGEYATVNGKSVKIGTCEDMYYLRADQAHTVTPERGSCDPRRADVRKVIRFRFPWPDEDTVAVGTFNPYERAVTVHEVELPENLEHYSVQFVAQAGYNLCLPCPEGPNKTPGVNIHRNGFAGLVQIVQQAYRGGVLAVICKCGGCGARFNLPTLKDAEPVIVACRAEADRKHKLGEISSSTWWHTIADRIEAGYQPVQFGESHEPPPDGP